MLKIGGFNIREKTFFILVSELLHKLRICVIENYTNNNV